MSQVESHAQSPEVKCKPDGIRVWRGYRSAHYLDKREAFDKAVRQIFVPHTAQQMMPLGLASYFPALLADWRQTDPSGHGRNDVQLILPDEIALVVYPSEDAYRCAVKDNVAGRAYAMLHSPLFNFDDSSPIPMSLSGSPVPWDGEPALDQAYSLREGAIDWRAGELEVLLVARPPNWSVAEFQKRVAALVDDWNQGDSSTVDGLIVVVSEHYCLVWQHREPDSTVSLIALLVDSLGTVQLRAMPRVVQVPHAFTRDDAGVDIEVGELLDVRLQAAAPD